MVALCHAIRLADELQLDVSDEWRQGTTKTGQGKRTGSAFYRYFPLPYHLHLFGVEVVRSSSSDFIDCISPTTYAKIAYV